MAGNVEYAYAQYNPGQYPDQMATINAMAADGWHVHTAMPNYNELYILWEREVPQATSGKSASAKDKETSSPGG